MMQFLGKRKLTPEEEFFNPEVYKKCCDSWGRCTSNCQVRARPTCLCDALIS